MAFAYNSFRRIKSAEGRLEQLREEDKYHLDMWVTEALILVGLLISPLSAFQKLIYREKETQEAAYYLHLIVQFNQECSFFERLDEQTSHWTPNAQQESKVANTTDVRSDHETGNQWFPMLLLLSHGVS
jgi:hypothetical protein